MFQRHVEIGHGLGLNSLRRIDDDQRAFASHQGASDLMRKVDMAGCVDKVQQVVFAIGIAIVERDRVALDGDTAFALDVHRIQHLFMQIALCDAIAGLDQPVRQGRLAMIDMGDNAEIANVFHGFSFNRKDEIGAGRCAAARGFASGRG